MAGHGQARAGPGPAIALLTIISACRSFPRSQKGSGGDSPQASSIRETQPATAASGRPNNPPKHNTRRKLGGGPAKVVPRGQHKSVPNRSNTTAGTESAWNRLGNKFWDHFGPILEGSGIPKWSQKWKKHQKICFDIAVDFRPAYNTILQTSCHPYNVQVGGMRRQPGKFC